MVLNFEVAGRPPVPPAQQPAMQVRVATPEYFSTIGIPLRRGRLFSDQDREGSPPVVLITEAAVEQYFPNEEPIGKKITLGWGRGPGTPRAGGEVIGIIGDVKDAGLNEADPPQIYLPYRQWPVQGMALVLKTSVPPASVADAARREVYAVDPSLPVANVRTLEQVVSRSISQPRFYMTLLAIFAGVALVLAAVGIFGVLSYAVVQRTREIGIRMALGARERSVVGLVVRHAMVMAVAGVAVGSVLGLGAVDLDDERFALQHRSERRRHVLRRRRHPDGRRAPGCLCPRPPGYPRGSDRGPAGGIKGTVPLYAGVLATIAVRFARKATVLVRPGKVLDIVNVPWSIS